MLWAIWILINLSTEIMKALSLILLAGLLVRFSVYGQLVAEDANGQSSILLNASTITLDLNAAALAANWNNFRKLAIEKPHQMIWGIDARGSNSDGVAELVSGGHFTPQSRISGYVALRRSYQNSALELLKRIRDIQDSENFPNEGAINTIRQLNDQVRNIREGQASKALTIYLNPGMNAYNFEQYTDLSTSTLAERFNRVRFRGAFLFAGLNYEYGRRWTLGIAAGFEHCDNLDSLSSRDYTVTNITVIGGSQLLSESKHHAYTGDYIVYNRVLIKTDALYFARLNDDYRLVWNTLFTRFCIPMNEKKINRVVQAGTALNFYKSEGKFAGGLYAQSNDIFNSLHTADSFTERISFGIVAKYAFGSIMTRDFTK